MPSVNFDLKIRATDVETSSYRVLADSTLGYEAEEILSVATAELLELQSSIHDGSSTARFNAAKIFGRRLFETFIQGGVAEIFFLSLGVAIEKAEILRIRLRFSEDTPELARLAWEYLYWWRRDKFFARSKETSVVRYLEVSEPYDRLPMYFPLRVLVVLSSPKDLGPLRPEKHLEKLRRALEPSQSAGQIVLDVLERPDYVAVRKRIAESKIHVLQFVGHGYFYEKYEEGILILEDSLSRGEEVRGSDWANLLGNHSSLRLVVLSACESAVSSSESSFRGVAQNLVRQGIPAVLAMQVPVPERAAIDLTAKFYGALARTGSLDSSLVEARIELSRNDSIEWGIPALFSRMTEDRLFEVRGCPGHPFHRELVQLEDLLHEGKIEQAADVISRMKLRGRLRGPGEELWGHQSRLEDHRRMVDRLDSLKLLTEVTSFVEKLRRA